MDGRYIEYINRGEYTYNVRDVEAERLSNKVTEFQETPTDTAYPSEKLVKDSLDALVGTVQEIADDFEQDVTELLDTYSSTLVVDSLPQEGVANTDYYVETEDNEIYLHYRWMPPQTVEPEENEGEDEEEEPTVIPGYFYAVGADAYTKQQVDTLLESKENTSNRVTAFQQTPDNAHYPSEKLVYDALELLHDTISDEMDELEIETTEVVNSLPAVAEADATLNYVLKQGNGALLYRVIDNQWRMIGGALVSVVDELPTDEHENPSGDAFTDYYVPTETANVYLHYRWMDTYTIPAEDPEEEDTVVAGHFYSVGADAYSKSEIDSKLSSIRTDHKDSSLKMKKLFLIK